MDLNFHPEGAGRHWRAANRSVTGTHLCFNWTTLGSGRSIDGRVQSKSRLKKTGRMATAVTQVDQGGGLEEGRSQILDVFWRQTAFADRLGGRGREEPKMTSGVLIRTLEGGSRRLQGQEGCGEDRELSFGYLALEMLSDLWMEMLSWRKYSCPQLRRAIWAGHRGWKPCADRCCQRSSCGPRASSEHLKCSQSDWDVLSVQNAHQISKA